MVLSNTTPELPAEEIIVDTVITLGGEPLVTATFNAEYVSISFTFHRNKMITFDLESECTLWTHNDHAGCSISIPSSCISNLNMTYDDLVSIKLKSLMDLEKVQWTESVGFGSPQSPPRPLFNIV